MNDFQKFAVSKGISSNKLDGYFKRQTNILEPYILEERQLNVASMSVLSRLFYDRIIFLADDVTSDSATIVKTQLLYLNSTGDDDISLFIDTRGGEVIPGLSIIDVMEYITPDVCTYCMGMCASMGAVILSNGAKGKRYSIPHGEIMIHQVSGGSQGVFSDMKINLLHSERLQKTLYEILASNTGKSFDEIAADADRDHWLTPEESLPGVYGKYGMIDEIIKKKQN